MGFDISGTLHSQRVCRTQRIISTSLILNLVNARFYAIVNLPCGTLLFTLCYLHTAWLNLPRKLTQCKIFEDLSEMGKSKPTQAAKIGNVKKGAEVKAISSVKEGAITKPSQTPKSKSKEIAKQVAAKPELVEKVGKGDKKSKKAKKEPTPEPSSSESESDEEMASGSSPGTSDESEPAESEVDIPKKAAKANGAKVGEKLNSPTKIEAESSPSSTSSDAESEGDSEDEEDVPAPIVPKSASAASKAAPTAKVGYPDDGSDSDVDSDEESGGDDDEEDSSEDESENDRVKNYRPEEKGLIDAKALNGALAKVASEQVLINPCCFCHVLSC